MPVRLAMQRFREYLQRRNYSAHTLDSYLLDLQLFFADRESSLAKITFREVDRFIDSQHYKGLAPATINRRLQALKHLFDYLIDQQVIRANPVKPSHVLRRRRCLPKGLTKTQVEALFAQIHRPMDRALFLLMLRCGLRVSEVAQLKLHDIDWSQQAVRIDHGKGRKDRQVYLSADAVASLRECLQQRPSGVPEEAVFGNQKRPTRTLSVKAIQKKMARYTKAAGIVASCPSVRHPFASNVLEQGAESVSIRALLGQASITSSER